MAQTKRGRAQPKRTKLTTKPIRCRACERLKASGARFALPKGTQGNIWARFAHFGPDGGWHYYYWPVPSEVEAKRLEWEVAPYADVPIKGPVHHGSRDVSQYVELKQAATGARFAAVNIGAMMRPDSLPADALDAADAVAVVVLNRASKSQNARLTNKKKRKNFDTRNAAVPGEFDELVLDGKRRRLNDRDAEAAARKSLAAKHNVTVERFRTIQRNERKKAANSTSR